MTGMTDDVERAIYEALELGVPWNEAGNGWHKACERAAIAAVEECARVAENYRKPTPPKPTIEELERILAQDTEPGIEITPDGEVRAAGTHIGHDIAAAIRSLAPSPKETGND